MKGIRFTSYEGSTVSVPTEKAFRTSQCSSSSPFLFGLSVLHRSALSGPLTIGQYGKYDFTINFITYCKTAIFNCQFCKVCQLSKSTFDEIFSIDGLKYLVLARLYALAPQKYIIADRYLKMTATVCFGVYSTFGLLDRCYKNKIYYY